MPKVPTLLEELEGFIGARGPRCGIGITLNDMPADLADQFRQLVAMGTAHAPTAAVSRMMRAKGYDMVTDNCLRRHRKGDCGCK